MEYSYRDGDDFVFTDPETYEPVTITPDLVGEAVDYMVENCLVELPLSRKIPPWSSCPRVWCSP